jgi:pimeloyl-ACP methyl ester carboxylesterase
VLRLLERTLTFKPSFDDHGGLADIPHERIRFGEDIGMSIDGAFVDNGSTSVILFTHGNRHNITKFREHYRLFTSLGHSFLTFDYPGYGESPGTPSEEDVYASAQAAYQHLTKDRGFNPQQIISYGCSMGGAVAIELVQRERVACLITESTFTNTWEMAKHLYPYFPVWPLLPKRFENDRKVPTIKVPMLIIHGERDPIVPVRMASELARVATSPARLLLIPEANHINSIEVGAATLQSTIRDFIGEHTS